MVVPPPAPAPAGSFSSLISLTTASVVSSRLAVLAAFRSAVRQMQRFRLPASQRHPDACSFAVCSRARGQLPLAGIDATVWGWCPLMPHHAPECPVFCVVDGALASSLLTPRRRMPPFAAQLRHRRRRCLADGGRGIGGNQPLPASAGRPSPSQAFAPRSPSPPRPSVVADAGRLGGRPRPQGVGKAQHRRRPPDPLVVAQPPAALQARPHLRQVRLRPQGLDDLVTLRRPLHRPRVRQPNSLIRFSSLRPNSRIRICQCSSSCGTK